jgi:hypothetical protein
MFNQIINSENDDLKKPLLSHDSPSLKEKTLSQEDEEEKSVSL